MSAEDRPPTDDEFDDAAELEEYMQDVYHDLRYYWSDRRYHDRDGYFCEIAGGAACEALGHKPDPEFGWDDDEEHFYGWDSEIICPATRWGAACSQCEGECDFAFFDAGALWKRVAA